MEYTNSEYLILELNFRYLEPPQGCHDCPGVSPVEPHVVFVLVVISLTFQKRRTYSQGIWIRWTGTVEWNGGMDSVDWNSGMDWTGMEWNGMAGCNLVINFVGVTEL